ncbi:ankyrin repeat family protein [Orientia chuto str. Dubai]|uniref:Ankyrin repeat family protein n=1 Tax=Orientia chuto str. Dubai TaxID=1359168 RepID=A0A0F3MLG9_9RICK|nr:ankyrin repeat domain-containing protein [Candidatus Orientia mediorientalis]KJV56560.1 ankyrin repeat family protein [Orientia chuto str. Dubai]
MMEKLLYYAANKGYSGTVNVLIKAGTDVNIQDIMMNELLSN